MNKAYSMIAAFSLIMASVVILPTLNIAFAQYGSAGTPGGTTLEEQLKLAKEKIGNAQQQGAYGSGTSMFGYSLDNTVIMIIAIVVILGGVAGAFFAAGRSGGKRPHLEATHGGSGSYSSGGKYCTNCGFQLNDGQKFCANCGTKT